MTDDRLDEFERHVARLNGGDEGARSDLFGFAFSRFEHLTRKMLKGFPGVRRWEQTDDVWQNASLRLWNSLQHVEVESPRHFFNLAALHIRRELLDLARRYSGPQGLGANYSTPELKQDSVGRMMNDPAARTADACRLGRWTEFHAYVNDLPESEREVFNLIWYQGLSQPEVAKMLQISLRTVKRRWQAARLALHDSLEMSDVQPRVVSPDVSRPLEAICLKAMAVDMGQRYQTAKDLADDVERWLADEPVSCHDYPLSQRAARWARRHKSWVTAAAVLVITSFAALVISTILINQERKFSEDSFQHARRAVDDSFVRVSQNKLLQVPGLRHLRKGLLEDSLQYYSQFLNQRGGDRAIDLQKADTEHAVAKINSELGDANAALTAWERALATYESLARKQPTDADLARKQAEVHREMGALHGTRDPDIALAHFRRALTILEEIQETQPSDRANCLRLLMHMGELHATSGRQKESREILEQARDRGMALAKEHPAVREYQHQVALVLRRLAANDEDVPRSLKSLQHARDILLRLTAAVTHDEYDVFQELASVYEEIGARHEQIAMTPNSKNDPTTAKTRDFAVKSLENAASIRSSLVDKHPSVPNFRFELAQTRMHLGRLQHDYREGRRASEMNHDELIQALRSFQDAHSIFEYLNEFELAKDMENHLLRVYYDMGLVHFENGRFDEASRSFEHCGQLSDRLENLPDPMIEFGLAQSHVQIGYYQWEVGKRDKAAKSFTRSRMIARNHVGQNPDQLKWQNILSKACLGAAMAHDQLEDFETALTSVDAALEQLHFIVQQDPEWPGVMHGLTCSYFQRGVILEKMNRDADSAVAKTESQRYFPKRPAELYELARSYAKYGSRIGSGHRRFSTFDRKEFDQYRDASVRCLKAAIHAGFEITHGLDEDPAFVPLGGHTGFEQLLAITQAK